MVSLPPGLWRSGAGGAAIAKGSAVVMFQRIKLGKNAVVSAKP